MVRYKNVKTKLHQGWDKVCEQNSWGAGILARLTEIIISDVIEAGSFKDIRNCLRGIYFEDYSGRGLGIYVPLWSK